MFRTFYYCKHFTVHEYTSIIAQNQTIWESGGRGRPKDKSSRKLTVLSRLVESMVRRVRLGVKVKPGGDNDGQEISESRLGRL